MNKIIKIGCAMMAVFLLWQISVLFTHKKKLRENLIRMHVVANSDTEEDQLLKLAVKDEIVSYLGPIMQSCKNKNEAQRFLSENLEVIKKIAQEKIAASGYAYSVEVSQQKEAFNLREYDTFALPAGIYDTLRVKIGNGNGKNWWCVTFPSLCLPTAAESFVSTAVQSGIDESLAKTLSNDDFTIRFYLLELLGKLEIFLSGK